MRVPPTTNPACAAFEEYKEVPKMETLDFTEDGIMWVPSKVSGAAGLLGAEDIELRNWIIYFWCSSEELRVLVAKLDD